MLDMSMGIGEHLVRGVVVYFSLFALLRVIGKKHVGELAPFDLLVLLILSETVQNALVGDDKSLPGGLVSAATLVGLAYIMSFIAWRSKKVGRWLEGTPKILVRHGSVCRDTLDKERVSLSELVEALRQEGASNITGVRAAVLENDGKITIIR